ncbi:MAG TPA: MFS transporter [Nitriliruptorales bacterium]|nr:MFS transporter [Nitriliruptorales bacterium]
MASRSPASGPRLEHRLVDLFRLRGFVHLLLVRWPSQAGDGMFQLGAASLLLFTLSPTEATSGGEVARVLAVTTLPFSFVGPFAGVVIDRWARQRILVWSNVGRIVVGIGGLAVVRSPGWGQAAFLVAVVLILSLNRFFLATLGAVLPRVVPGEALTPANAVAAVGGSIAALAGGAVGGLLASLIGEDRGGPEAALTLSYLLVVVSVVAARRFPVRTLGPDLDREAPPLHRELRRAADELMDGLRRIGRTRRAWAPIVTLAVLRFLTAIASIAALLVFRNLYGAGPGEIAIVLTLFGIGAGAGAALVAAADRRGLRPETSLNLSLLVGGVALLVFAPGLRQWALYAVNLVLGVAFAMAKIPGDTLVQSALADRYRGRVFAAYDVVYNVGFLAGAIVTALTLADAAQAEPVLVGCGLTSVALGVVGRRWLVRMPPPVDVETWEEAEHVLDAT